MAKIIKVTSPIHERDFRIDVEWASFFIEQMSSYTNNGFPKIIQIATSTFISADQVHMFRIEEE